MKLDFSFLADRAFGWVFVWMEIVLFYIGFLIFHRIVERKRRQAGHKSGD